MASHQARLAGPFDLELLAALHRQCFCEAGDEVWDLPAITTLLESPGVFAYLAVAGVEMPVGLIIARLAGGEGEILTIGILPDHRRRRHGLALIEAVASHALESGADSLFLEVAADNHAAQALYGNGGFRPVGRRAGYYRRDDGTDVVRVDAIILRRALRPAEGDGTPADIGPA